MHQLRYKQRDSNQIDTERGDFEEFENSIGFRIREVVGFEIEQFERGQQTERQARVKDIEDEQQFNTRHATLHALCEVATT
jgi:hypothetical protein